MLDFSKDFQNGIYAYTQILIDTDLEPDDKAALEIFFRELYFYAEKNPDYRYPTITIVAGSSTTPEIKKAQAQAILQNLTRQGFIPLNADITIVTGSPTWREYPDDGKELLTKEQLENVIYEAGDAYSEIAIQTIQTFLNNANKNESVYIGLQSVKDLHAACDGLPQDKFDQVDFMATLSFNVTSEYGENGNEFINKVLSRFRKSLCYENYHSACQNNSTGKIWGESFKNYLRSDVGRLLRKAGEIWDNALMEGFVDSFEHPLFGEVWGQSQNGTLKMSEEEFVNAIKEEMGEEITYERAFRPFCSIAFDGPQLCLADVAFLTVICHPEILKNARQPKTVEYNGSYSCIADDPDSLIQYVIMDEEQLVLLGEKATATLYSPAIPAFKMDEILEKNATHAIAYGQNQSQSRQETTDVVTPIVDKEKQGTRLSFQ